MYVGMAGGSPWAIGAPGWAPGGAASAGVRYQNTSHAKQGDRGSQVLPAAPSGTTWKAGELIAMGPDQEERFALSLNCQGFLVLQDKRLFFMTRL